MQNKKLAISIIASFLFLVIIETALFSYPHIEFKRNGKFYACRYSDDFSEFEENASFNELYFYYENGDVSLKNFEVKNFCGFYLFSFDYVEGDVRATEFMLKEEFITYWLENAEIEENEGNIDIAKLIEGKTAVVSNKRYSGNEYDKCITYKLDGKWETLYVFESEGLTVIQVGSNDELPKFIAYKKAE